MVMYGAYNYVCTVLPFHAGGRECQRRNLGGAYIILLSHELLCGDSWVKLKKVYWLSKINIISDNLQSKRSTTATIGRILHI